ncbi:hypothetical protein [Rhodococcus sp. IEGM 1408]|uniref:hypothetical protein n=1 Tax=Rhodococcus sp. IEGM 1408 TaxID=3082220 RepID=UPI0029536A40|nr:hypothetical protein [Rhodococcus sp. IEGM 1408]MDV8000976.1 hypothetical protein [Rhodococcus sp. IEGM 1408]
MTASQGPQPTGGSAADRTDGPAADHAADHAHKNADDHTTGSPEMTTDAVNPTATFTPTDTFAPTDAASRPDQPLYAPLPYGTGFTAPEQFGYGVAPGAPETRSTPSATTAVARRERPGSPVLAVAGLLSLAVAVWAVLGAPAISTTAVLTAGLVLTVLVGLAMVVRR